ncbi:LysR family transcriptional regulator [Curvivirga aplysinae]|uniref:LysR family transcriptional regulator n=1 Tax=Curvivirga aplysinae TaxID=2529852 RepID=UPI0012BD1AAF|nr:LysR family transcriptional regulator [Curvivirga aplysinae]MTI09916.1 LysR family transcriptional regulator [Curvivirga aplysinae]
MTDISDLVVYVRVVDQGSLSAAGRELRMSPAVVSHRLQRLEARLGVRLLNRTTRKVHTTEEGEIYYGHCLRILEEVEKAEQALTESRENPSGLLKITAPVSFGRRYLAPLIPDFVKAYPEVEPRLHLTESLVNLVEDGFDLAIRVGRMEDSSLMARKLAKDHRYICASPEYLEKHGTPKIPQDLLDHNCLLLRFPGSRQFKWRLVEDGVSHFLAVKGDLDTNNSDVLLDWALSGCGIVMKSQWEVGEHIKSGELIPFLEEYVPQDNVVAALYPQGKHVPPKLRVFIDFLVERISHPVPWE